MIMPRLSNDPTGDSELNDVLFDRPALHTSDLMDSLPACIELNDTTYYLKIIKSDGKWVVGYDTGTAVLFDAESEFLHEAASKLSEKINGLE